MDDEAIIERQLTALVRLVDFVFAPATGLAHVAAC